MSAGIPKRVSTTESRGVRWLLTALALGFMALFLVLPLAAVFAIYFYLVKKGPRYTTILLSIVALSVVCSLLGVL